MNKYYEEILRDFHCTDEFYNYIMFHKSPIYNDPIDKNYHIDNNIKRSDCRVIAWTKQIKTRANYKCEICGDDKRINSHHIESFKENPELRIDTNNGICLCYSHHRLLHNLYSNSTNKEHLLKFIGFI